jgi:hypothetical protein
MTQRFVVCLKYGTLYPAAYVNVLYNAVRRSITGDFRFICLTDRAEGIDPGVEVLPIPDVGLTPRQWFIGGVWPKIGLFDAYFHGLKGRVLFIDLDMVVLRGLDAFFEINQPFVGLNAGPGWGRGGQPTEFGSAIISFDIGSLGHVADHFRQNKDAVIASFRTEQAFVASRVKEIHFWPEGWVLSFKRSLRQPLGLDLFVHPKEPPQTARLVAFHGTPRPRDLLLGGPLFWDRFPHLGHGVVPWMQDYWESNGGPKDFLQQKP